MLELAAGPADTGLLAAELVAPGGKAIITDNAEAMLEAAKARAEEVGATNVEIRPMEAEWIDLPTASVDARPVPLGLHAARRPGGGAARDAARAAARRAGRARRVGRARRATRGRGDRARAWSSAGLIEPPPDPTRRARSRSADPGRIEELLDAAGFDDIDVEPLDFAFHAATLDDVVGALDRDVGVVRATSSAALSPAEHYALRDAVDAAYAPVRAATTARSTIPAARWSRPPSA